MKYFFLFIVTLFSAEVFSQQEGASGNFIHLSQVQKPPLSPDCDVHVALCTAKTIEKFVTRIITSAGPVTNGISGKTEIQTKVIIDTLGQISWASLKGLPLKTGKKLAERLKEMPAFTPGEHNGQKTNVIVDLITPFYFWDAKDFSSEAIHITKAEIQPVWHRCGKSKEDSCTPKEVQNWINRNIDLKKFKRPGFYALTSTFVVGPDGEVSRISVHGEGDELATEVFNKLQKMPRFEPAKMGEESIATYYIVPITLRWGDY